MDTPQKAHDFVHQLYESLIGHREEIMRLRISISDGTPRWVSVKERLPGDDEGQVLAVNSAGFYACVNTIYQNTDGKYDGEDATPEETIDLIGDITHWMPIPEGPK